jgi:hypothetical protein
VKVRLLKWKATGEEDARELGNKASGAMTMEETTKSLKNIQNIVSMQVSYADMLVLVSPHAVPADGSWLSDGDRCIATSDRFKPCQR